MKLALIWIAIIIINITVTVTAYNASSLQTDSTPMITASNIRVRSGICAVSRDIERRFKLKFGDIIHLENIGSCEFQDRMHRRKRKQVDLFMWEYKDAIEFGVQKSRLIRGE